ncbi:MAG: adenine-specific methyltransferase EcoRI family protein [Candidatus Coproplasma sp.]
MAGNSSLIKANKEKNDEFYTQLSDIENEMRHYKEQFKNKTILCNCDDPFESNFFKYFAMNFNFLGLKKLIATSYDNSPVAYTQLSFIGNDKTTPNKNRRAYKIEITEVDDYNCDGAVDLSDVEYLLKNKENTLSLLKGNGDFRSEECIELLKQADIVVTNPPFSLFREYVAQLVEYDKKFIILGNMNAITYKEIFPLLKNNIIWLGYKSGAQEFYVPMSFERDNTYINATGHKIAKFGNICWFTNLDTVKRHEDLTLFKKYTPEEYPKYDNYNAINVNKTSDIPYDYNGYMGVPITFLDKYNPEQFEIIGNSSTLAEEIEIDGKIKKNPQRFYVNGKRMYDRIVIQAK